MFFLPGRRVTVSLTDGSSLKGTTWWAWPGQLRLGEVETRLGSAPGYVVIYKHAVLTVQVVDSGIADVQ